MKPADESPFDAADRAWTEGAKQSRTERERSEGRNHSSTKGEQRANGADESPLPLIWASDITLDAEPPALVAGLLIDGGLSVVFGEAGCGKTFFAMDLGLHIATRPEWFGRTVSNGGVIYIAAESPQGARKRTVAWFQHHGIVTDGAPFALIPCTVDLCHRPGDVPALIAAISDASAKIKDRIRLVVVDTTSRAMAGGDENSSVDVGALVKAVDDIRSATGAHVLLIHHTGKDSSKGARGHSILRAAVDTEIEVTRESASKVSIARVSKQRELDTAGNFAFRLQVVELPNDADGSPRSSCVVMPTEGATTVRRPKLTPTAQRALDQLRNALATGGQPAPDAIHFPARPVVPERVWKDYCTKAGIIDPNASNPRADWKRLRERLQSAGYVGIWDGLVWDATTVAGRSNA